jgi:hypothetical protein
MDEYVAHDNFSDHQQPIQQSPSPPVGYTSLQDALEDYLESLDMDEQILQELNSHIKLDNLCHSAMYIDALRVASLNDPGTGMTANALKHLQNPPSKPTTINDNVTATAIKLYLNLTHANYNYITTINSCA